MTESKGSVFGKVCLLATQLKQFRDSLSEDTEPILMIRGVQSFVTQAEELRDAVGELITDKSEEQDA